MASSGVSSILNKIIPANEQKKEVQKARVDPIDWKNWFENGLLSDVVNPKTWDDYILVEYLGAGSYGQVFRAYHSTFGDVAIKLFNIINGYGLDDFEIEASAYTYLSKTPHCQSTIVCLYDQFLIPDIRPMFPTHRFGGAKYSLGALVYELMDGDLSDPNNVPDENIPRLIYDLIHGLQFIHSHGFAHRDIKPANLLYKGDLYKYGDLGLICGQNEATKQIEPCSNVGTRIYASPTNIQNWGKPASLEQAQENDIWTLGLSLYVIVYKRFPFYFGTNDHQGQLDFLRNMSQGQVDAALASTPYVRQETPALPASLVLNLISAMLRVNPKERPSAADLQDWLESVNPYGSPCDDFRSRLNVKRVIQQIEMASLDLIKNNLAHYDEHLQEINRIMAEDCFDHDYLNQIYRVYHDDVMLRKQKGKPDNLVAIGDVVLNEMARFR